MNDFEMYLDRYQIVVKVGFDFINIRKFNTTSNNALIDYVVFVCIMSSKRTL